MFVVKNSKGIHEGTILLNITQASYSSSVFSSSPGESSSSESSSRAYSHLISPGYFVTCQLVVLYVVLSSQPNVSYITSCLSFPLVIIQICFLILYRILYSLFSSCFKNRINFDSLCLSYQKNKYKKQAHQSSDSLQ